MASLSSLSSLCYLSQNPSPLRFTTKAIFLHPKTNEVRRVPVFRVSSKMVFPNLQADDYRHPLDLEGIRLFKSQPDSSAEMEEAFKDVVARFLAVGAFPSEKVEDDGTSVLAGPTQHSDTYKLMAETAEILNITTPLLYIRRQRGSQKVSKIAVGIVVAVWLFAAVCFFVALPTHSCSIQVFMTVINYTPQD